MLITVHEKSAIRDLEQATSRAFARRVCLALRESETDGDFARRIGLQLDDSAMDARLLLDGLPQSLRAGNVIFLPGECRGTWSWIAFAWLRFHGETFSKKNLRVSSGQMVGWANFEWGDPAEGD